MANIAPLSGYPRFLGNCIYLQMMLIAVFTLIDCYVALIMIFWKELGGRLIVQHSLVNADHKFLIFIKILGIV